jgi:hypothetical protein
MAAGRAMMCASAAAQKARDPNTYVLKEKENQKIFSQRIFQLELAHLKVFGHLRDGVQPIVVFVVGQTGSGKTRLAADLLDVVHQRLPVHLVAEVYKIYGKLPYLLKPRRQIWLPIGIPVMSKMLKG